MLVDGPPKINRDRWSRLIPFWWLLVFALPALAGFGAPRVVDNAYTPMQQVRIGETAVWQVDDPVVSATAYLFYDVDADQVLFAQNSNRALPPASLTKLMTALLVLEAQDLQRELVVQSTDLVGGTAMGLVPGEVITVEELLWGLLLPSGNDAAMALARQLGGTVEDFVAQMNARAATLGLRATHFVNPHGLDADGHLSSAADLLTLVRRNWDFPLFREIVATRQATVNGHFLRNTNELLGTYAGTNGVKTGTTDAAGQCLVAGFQQDGHQVYGIVLGSSDRYSDMRTLHSHYLAGYRWFMGRSQEFSVLNRLYGPNGRLWYLRLAEQPPTVFVHAAEVGQLAQFRRLTLPVAQPWQAGMQVGVMEWRLHNRVVATQPLLLW